MRLPAIIFCLALLSACSPEPAPPPYVDSTSPEGEPVRTYTSAAWRVPSQGRHIQMHTGELAFKGMPGTRRIIARELSAELIATAGDTILTLDAGQLFLVSGDQEFAFSDGVLLDAYGAHAQVEADSAVWQLKEGTFRCGGEVRIFTSKGILNGKGMEGDLLLQKWRVDQVAGFVETE